MISLILSQEIRYALDNDDNQLDEKEKSQIIDLTTNLIENNYKMNTLTLRDDDERDLHLCGCCQHKNLSYELNYKDLRNCIFSSIELMKYQQWFQNCKDIYCRQEYINLYVLQLQNNQNNLRKLIYYVSECENVLQSLKKEQDYFQLKNHKQLIEIQLSSFDDLKEIVQYIKKNSNHIYKISFMVNNQRTRINSYYNEDVRNAIKSLLKLKKLVSIE